MRCVRCVTLVFDTFINYFLKQKKMSWASIGNVTKNVNFVGCLKLVLITVQVELLH